MGEVVNLRRARKAKARAAKEAAATVNRVAFGRSRAQKKADHADADRLHQELDGATLDR